MEIVTIVLALLFAVLVGDWITRFLPVPPPLVQIALGVTLAVAPVPSVRLDPHIFFLVFLPPLLFLDGWRIPKRDLKRDGATVLALALGLVLFTVVGIGFFIAWLIPTMPLAVAFALAAVLSPTDPIAVGAVAARAPIPKRLMHILEGESLLNDASGLVCLRFATAAALTGQFSLGEATLSFLWLGLGGAAVGIGLTYAITWIEGRMLGRGDRDPGGMALFSILIPYAVYLVAEAIDVSGILAAAAAGIAMTYVENSGRAEAPVRIRRTAVWDTVQLVGNGAIFVLLGEQLPGILEQAAAVVNAGDRRAIYVLPLYVLAITAGLLVLRFSWVYVSLRLVLLRARFKGDERPEGLTWHLVATTTVAGVKGAITLAGALTLPFFRPDNTPLPARGLAIFLAMGVILVSLLLATMLLPGLLKRLQLPPESPADAEEDRAREVAGGEAMDAIESLKDRMLARASKKHDDVDDSLYAEAADRAMERYSRRELAKSNEEARARSRELRRIERRLRLAGLRAERDALYRLRRQARLEDGMLRRLVREVDLLESRYAE